MPAFRQRTTCIQLFGCDTRALFLLPGRVSPGLCAIPVGFRTGIGDTSHSSVICGATTASGSCAGAPTGGSRVSDCHRHLVFFRIAQTFGHPENQERQAAVTPDRSLYSRIGLPNTRDRSEGRVCHTVQRSSAAASIVRLSSYICMVTARQGALPEQGWVILGDHHTVFGQWQVGFSLPVPKRGPCRQSKRDHLLGHRQWVEQRQYRVQEGVGLGWEAGGRQDQPVAAAEDGRRSQCHRQGAVWSTFNPLRQQPGRRRQQRLHQPRRTAAHRGLHPVTGPQGHGRHSRAGPRLLDEHRAAL